MGWPWAEQQWTRYIINASVSGTSFWWVTFIPKLQVLVLLNPLHSFPSSRRDVAAGICTGEWTYCLRQRGVHGPLCLESGSAAFLQQERQGQNLLLGICGNNVKTVVVGHRG